MMRHRDFPIAMLALVLAAGCGGVPSPETDPSATTSSGGSSGGTGQRSSQGESSADAGTTGDVGGTGGDESGATGNPPLEPSTRFDARALAWSVPNTHDDSAPSQLGGTFTGLVDIDADGMLELISTGQCLDNGDGSCTYTAWGDESGAGYWRVYDNLGDGFADTPMQWAVPDTHDARAPSQLGGTFTGLVDIDADGALELISTGQCLDKGDGNCTYTAWGDESGAGHWRVYDNLGEGFAMTPTQWSVPDTHGDIAPSQLGGTFTGLVDIDGDGDLELLSTGECLANGDGSCTYTAWGDGSGAGYWRVYDNLGDGFADSPTQWAVPDTHAGHAPSQLGGTLTGLVDIDADGALELISTGQCLDDGDGCTYTAWDDENGPGHWRVYDNLGDGFSESPTQWPVPDTHGDRAPSQLGGTFTGLVDIDADEVLELVSTGQCLDNADGGCTYTAWGDENGLGHWRVYDNLGDRFADAPVEWPVPDTHGDRAPSQLGGTFTGLVDLNGDERIDLVSTGQCLDNADDSCTYTAWGDEVGSAHFRLHRGLP